jgi:GNAT superfamily N-acetyltransferase
MRSWRLRTPQSSATPCLLTGYSNPISFSTSPVWTARFEDYAEVKRMYAREPGRGIGKALLARLEAEARNAGKRLLRLETGIHQTAAIALYERWGFRRRGPFGHYAELSPNATATSVFYERPL